MRIFGSPHFGLDVSIVGDQLRLPVSVDADHLVADPQNGVRPPAGFWPLSTVERPLSLAARGIERIAVRREHPEGPE